jgi:hypothetical protein
MTTRCKPIGWTGTGTNADDAWNTLEVPVHLADSHRHVHGPAADVILVDCLTLWLSNLLMQTQDVQPDPAADRRSGRGREIGTPCAVVLVSNEVGAGIVPENRLARLYRDLAGWTNQAMAAACRPGGLDRGRHSRDRQTCFSEHNPMTAFIASLQFISAISLGKTATLRCQRDHHPLPAWPDWPSA